MLTLQGLSPHAFVAYFVEVICHLQQEYYSTLCLSTLYVDDEHSFIAMVVREGLVWSSRSGKSHEGCGWMTDCRREGARVDVRYRGTRLVIRA